MSMISEQVKELIDFAKYWEYNVPKKPIPQIFNEAADTIETLSAKLQAANMECLTAYYNGGWVPCSERFPENGETVLIDTGIGYLEIAEYCGDGTFCAQECCRIEAVAWISLPEPYKPQ